MGCVGQVFNIKLVFPVEHSKGGAEAKPFTIPWDVPKNVAQTYGKEIAKILSLRIRV